MTDELGSVILFAVIAVSGLALVVSVPVLGVAVVRADMRGALRVAGWMLALAVVAMGAAAWVGASASPYSMVG